MTFRSFTNVDDLFTLLVQRFRIQPPYGLEPKELDDWTKQKQHIIQMRVLNIFKSMVIDDVVLEKEDLYILERIRDFVSRPEVSHFTAARALSTLIWKKQNHTTETKSGIILTTAAVPPPIHPKHSKKMKLLDIDPLEMARQLTIIESKLYQRIQPIECLQRSRENKAVYNDNITAITQNFNRLSTWTQECILAKEDLRERINVIKYFINVAEKCRTMNNFSSMMSILSGLNATPVRRLRRSWEQVNSKLMAQMRACESIIDPNRNFTNYRRLFGTITPPCVPYVGVFLTTLAFIQEGSKDTLSNNIVNFRKRQRAAEVMNDIRLWQSHPHVFHALDNVLAFIKNALDAYSDEPDVADRFWQTSLMREPREADDSRMARLLHESGFL